MRTTASLAFALVLSLPPDVNARYGQKDSPLHDPNVTSNDAGQRPPLALLTVPQRVTVRAAAAEEVIGSPREIVEAGNVIVLAFDLSAGFLLDSTALQRALVDAIRRDVPELELVESVYAAKVALILELRSDADSLTEDGELRASGTAIALDQADPGHPRMLFRFSAIVHSGTEAVEQMTAELARQLYQAKGQ